MEERGLVFERVYMQLDINSIAVTYLYMISRSIIYSPDIILYRKFIKGALSMCQDQILWLPRSDVYHQVLGIPDPSDVSSL